MPFFLLGKGPDGQLRLLSDETVPTRHEALTRLSEITASPEFDGWDSEVFAVDLDQATPVLLVRPAVTEPLTSSLPTPSPLTSSLPTPSPPTRAADAGDASLDIDEAPADANEGAEGLPAPMTFVVPDTSRDANTEPIVSESPEEMVPEGPESPESSAPAAEVADDEATVSEESDEEPPVVDANGDEEPGDEEPVLEAGRRGLRRGRRAGGPGRIERFR